MLCQLHEDVDIDWSLSLSGRLGRGEKDILYLGVHVEEDVGADIANDTNTSMFDAGDHQHAACWTRQSRQHAATESGKRQSEDFNPRVAAFLLRGENSSDAVLNCN